MQIGFLQSRALWEIRATKPKDQHISRSCVYSVHVHVKCVSVAVDQTEEFCCFIVRKFLHFL